MFELLAAFAVSLGFTLLLVRRAKSGAHRFHDHDLSGPQKFHAVPVPRVGGIGIFAGALAGVAMLWLRQPKLLAPQRSTRTISICDARRFVEVEAITGARQASFHQGAAAGVDAAQNAGLEELPQCPGVELESEIV